jgi:hypothetical protein
MNFAMLVVSTLIALASFVGFESMIVSVETRAEAIRLEIATDERMLGRGVELEQMSARTENQLHEWHLLDQPSRQVVMIFATLEAIARNRQVQFTAFRHQLFPGAAAPQHEPALRSDQLDVTLEGGYPALLAVLADLSRSPLIMHSYATSFERSGNRVRAALSLAVYRLGENNVRNESAHNE